MEWLNVTAESGLWGLLLASFLSATVLPGGSEALLWGFLKLHPGEFGPALLLAWAPLIGDALCVAAGWLRLHWLPCCLFMAIGKFVRYWLVAQTALAG